VVSLKKILARAFLVGLPWSCVFRRRHLSDPGYKDKPDEWAAYDRGQYFEQLQTIVKTYRFDGSKITYHHFEENGRGNQTCGIVPYSRGADAGLQRKKTAIFLCLLLSTIARHLF